MKIMIIGYSGSGKSTLAKELSRRYQIPVLHLDVVHHLPHWQARNIEEEREILGSFLDEHDSWVIDGTYARNHYERRLKEADQIVVMLFGRWPCLYRVIKRYVTYRDTVRPDIAEGCKEKLDATFIKWVLFDGRKRNRRQLFLDVIENYSDKVIILTNQKELNHYLETINFTEISK